METTSVWEAMKYLKYNKIALITKPIY